MKTKDFIKMLQDADPTGEAHIRFSDGNPLFAELKEGYWDGAYHYKDDENNYVLSTLNDKIDIYFEDTYDFIESIIEENWKGTVPYETLWEIVKSKFRFELTYVHKQDKIDEFLKKRREEFDECINIHTQINKNNLNRVIELFNNGCKVFRKREIKNLFDSSNWKFSNNIIDANTGTIDAIVNSGRFKEFDYDDEYIEYKLK